jgi:DNA ligase (NAD+)
VWPAVVKTDPVEALAAQIRAHRAAYYRGEPDIEDEEFDALEDRLRALAPNHPVLAEVGATPESEPRDGSVPRSELQAERTRDAEDLAASLQADSDAFYEQRGPSWSSYKARYLALVETRPDHPVFDRIVPARGLEWPKASHEIPMGSLNKVNTPEELHQWAERCDQLAQGMELEPVSSDLAVVEKLDGISIELVYDHGRFETAITRGDGVIGERITPNALRMKGVREKIEHSGRVSVRGEIILRKSDAEEFSAFKREVDPKFEKLKSLRNTAAGVARTKDLKHLPGCALLTVLFFDVEGIEELDHERHRFEWLREQGFDTPRCEFLDLAGVERLHAEYQDRTRGQLDYEIDGLVVRVASLRAFALLGELNNRPRAAVAYKFGNEMQVSGVQSIEWSTGDSGRVTPIARIDPPVFLAGAEVRQASLHNLARVQSLQIGPGDQALVSRRNDVIPYVEKVVVDGGETESAPARCGVCETELERDGEYLVCPNRDCPARVRGRLKTWVKQLGLLEWGEKTLEALHERGLVREPADLYRLSTKDLTALPGFGEVSAGKLLNPLHAKKDIPFPTFIAALGIPAVSKETGKLLMQAGFDTLDSLYEATPEQLAEVEGLGAIKADKISTGLSQRKAEIERLAEVGVRPVRPEHGGPLHGLSFCFSGAHSRPRKTLARWVEDHGGTVASGVTKGLSYLVLSDPNSTSSKAQKARKLGVEILDEAGFEALLESKGVALKEG